MGRKKGREGCRIDSDLPQQVVLAWHRHVLSAEGQAVNCAIERSGSAKI